MSFILKTEHELYTEHFVCAPDVFLSLILLCVEQLELDMKADKAGFPLDST